MISVLIVDDEYLIRSLIRNSIPWEKYGLEVIGEAGDGEEALSFIEIHRPQIALVDINMP
ncbi:MAG: response regulator, partial [Oscillibacter sp.]|nr:response regulator [Oscillibacter sp.]